MDVRGDLGWGIAVVNLRVSVSPPFAAMAQDPCYRLRTISPECQIAIHRIRAHTGLHDWAAAPDSATALLASSDVHMVTINVIESGYSLDSDGQLNLTVLMIAREIAEEASQSVYAYLADALRACRAAGGAPLSTQCCNNIRQNGKMLGRNLPAYLKARGLDNVLTWTTPPLPIPLRVSAPMVLQNTAFSSALL